MARKIAIIGTNGQLGHDLLRRMSKDSSLTLFPLSHAQIEITNPHSIKDAFHRIRPDIIINAAAYNKVDEIEKSPVKAYEINALANKYLAIYCRENDVLLVHISTDYVFGTDTNRTIPYQESDLPGPVNAYGISKLSGEYFVRGYCQKYFILRTCGLFGIATSSGKGGNFVTNILQIAKGKKEISVVNDQIVSPTYTYDLAKQIVHLLETDAYGLYHATSEGQCSWYEFTKKIFTLTKTTTVVKPIPSSAYKTLAKRPGYSVLENANLKKIHKNIMRNWQEGLEDYLREKGLLHASHK